MTTLFRFLACALAASLVADAADLSPSSRTPWTTSTITGSPDAPALFCVERAFPGLTFPQPLEVAVLPGTNRLVVVEREGKLRSFRTDETTTVTDLFGDLARFDPELSECFSITFHPNFSQHRFAYVLAIAKTRGSQYRENGTQIIRFQVTTDPVPRLDLASGRVIITWLQGGHNGGNLRFGPDGMLYFGAGDAGPAEPPDPRVTGQDISDLLASILRIDVDRTDPGLSYSIPRDNPLRRRTAGPRRGLGLRVA